jgi:hypothetical protein
MENSHRLARKYFKCHKCKNLESQLIHPNKFQIKCSSCGIYLNEIPEKEFKILKKNKNYSLNKSNNGHTSDSPYIPPENAFNNISSVYNRPPSNLRRQNNNNENNNRNNRFNNYNININNINNDQRRNQRYQSTSHYSDLNIINNDNNNNNRNNISNNISNNENRINEERNKRYGEGARNRGNSQEPSHLFNNFFNNMFGIFPMMNVTPIIISQRGEGQPYRIYVQSQNVSQNIFDPIFLAFGSMFDNNFRNNFSSNFRSNFRGNFLNEIIRILERNQEEAARKAHPPTSESALKKLKRFPLSEKYCKKDKKGKLELPSCCICLNDIQMKEETVLLPCGHMFHWNCCLSWLKGNNTCPMCRFVIKD